MELGLPELRQAIAARWSQQGLDTADQVVVTNGAMGAFQACLAAIPGTLLRLLIRNGVAANDAVELLEATTVHPNHRFWTDDVPYDSAMLSGVVGHRQVTDAYLAAQARLRSGRLATFDAGLAAAHPDVVELIRTM